MREYTIWFDQVGVDDVPRVGGKNALLGEMIAHLASADVKVPPGFATTASAFLEFLQSAGIDQKIKAELAGLEVDDLSRLSHTGQIIRELIRSAAPYLLRSSKRFEIRTPAWKSAKAKIARWRFAPRPRLKICLMHPLPVNKSPISTSVESRRCWTR